MKRYSLVCETKYCDKKIIMIDDNEKSPLFKIDLLTSNYPNKVILYKELGLDLNIPIKNFKFYISYNQNKKIKKLPVAYSNKKSLANVSMISDSRISLEDKYFREIVGTFFNAIERKEYREILEKDKVLSLKLHGYVLTWLLDKDKTDLVKMKIERDMAQYKQLRDIIFSFEKYNNRQKLR